MFSDITFIEHLTAHRHFMERQAGIKFKVVMNCALRKQCSPS